MNELGTYLFRNHYQICRPLKQNTSEISRVRACVCVHLSVGMPVYVRICVVNVCVCMCVHECEWAHGSVWVHILTHIHTHTHMWKLEINLTLFLRSQPPILWGKISHWDLELACRLDCLTWVCTRTRVCVHTHSRKQHPLASAHQCWGYKYLSPH